MKKVKCEQNKGESGRPELRVLNRLCSSTEQSVQASQMLSEMSKDLNGMKTLNHWVFEKSPFHTEGTKAQIQSSQEGTHPAFVKSNKEASVAREE